MTLTPLILLKNDYTILLLVRLTSYQSSINPMEELGASPAAAAAAAAATDIPGDDEPHILPVPPFVRQELPVEDYPDVVGTLRVDKQGRLLKEFFDFSGKVGSLIESYNDWIINDMIKQLELLRFEFAGNRVVVVTNRIISRPTVSNGRDDVRPLYPQEAYLNDLTYSADIYVDLELLEKDREGNLTPVLDVDDRPKVIPKVLLGRIPVMVGSVLDNMVATGEIQDGLPTDTSVPPCVRDALGQQMGSSEGKRIAGRRGLCITDPLGYFIIKGTERVVMLVEKLRLGLPIIFNSSAKGDPICRMTVDTPLGTMINTVQQGKDGDIKLSLPFMKTKAKKTGVRGRAINIFHAYQVLRPGISHAEIIQVILEKVPPKWASRIQTRLMPALLKAASTTPDQWFTKLAEKLGLKKTGNVVEQLKDEFDKQLFPQLEGREFDEDPEQSAEILNFMKVHMLSVMVAKYVSFLAGLRSIDDRDDWGIKRIVNAGRSMSDLFINILREMKGRIDNNLKTDSRDPLVDIKAGLSSPVDYILTVFITSFVSNWGIPNKAATKDNIADILRNNNPLDRLSQIASKIVAVASRKGKNPKIRMVQMSQLGYVCPAETPEGSQCGLVKHTALTTWVSIRSDPDIIISRMEDYDDEGKVDNPDDGIGLIYFNPTDYMLWVNDELIGWCNPDVSHRYLLSLRRTCQIAKDVEIVRSDRDKTLFVFTSSSRPTRPLLIVDDDGELVIQKKKLWRADMLTLMQKGCVEYIGSMEQHYIIIAPTLDDLEYKRDQIAQTRLRLQRSKALLLDGDPDGSIAREVMELDRELNKLIVNRYTHSEIDPTAILGIAASMVPKANHNQAPRNTYACGMGRQALSVSHSNPTLRFDTTVKCLAYPSPPLFQTQTAEMFGFSELPLGQTVTLAIMPYKGFNQEDAVIINRAALDRGLFRMVVYKGYSTVVKSRGSTSVEELGRPKLRKGDDPELYSAIGENGMPIVGRPVKEGYCIIGKIRKVTGDAGKIEENASVFLGIGQEGVIDKVYRGVNKEGNTIIKVKVRDVRVPVVGDKFSSRHAQKTTIGLILPPEDMPTTMRGITPDMIINPTAIPSRMTNGKMIEIAASKFGALKGERINGTSFRPFDADELMRNLREYGFRGGKERMINGTTGEMMEARIFIGPCFYMALRHHVKDKFQVRGTGAMDQLYRTPVGGRSKGGGQRMGEMERDALLAHGASAVVNERMCLASDKFTTVRCIDCGGFAVSDNSGDKYACNTCKSNNVGKCTTPYAFNLMTQILAAAGIQVKPKFKVQDVKLTSDPQTMSRSDEDDGGRGKGEA